MEKIEIELGQRIWDYMNIAETDLTKSDLILCLGSRDILTADRVAELYPKYGNLVLFSGKGGRNCEKFPWRQGLTEARMLADAAIERGLPESAILLEEESTNTGQNILYSKTLLDSRGIYLNDLIVVHMPSSLRRDFLTLRKQWKEPQPNIQMVSPNVPFEEYHIRGYQGIMSQRDLLCDMLGDLQRIKVNAGKFNLDEYIPDEIKDAYYELVNRGYVDQLVKNESDEVIGIG